MSFHKQPFLLGLHLYLQENKSNRLYSHHGDTNVSHRINLLLFGFVLVTLYIMDPMSMEVPRTQANHYEYREDRLEVLFSCALSTDLRKNSHSSSIFLLAVHYLQLRGNFVKLRAKRERHLPPYLFSDS